MARSKRNDTIPCPAGCGADLRELGAGDEHYCAAIESDDGHTHSFNPSGHCTEEGCGMTVEEAIRLSARAPLDGEEPEQQAEPEPVAVTGELVSCLVCDKPITPEEAAQYGGLCESCSDEQAAVQLEPVLAAVAAAPVAETLNACPFCGQEFAGSEFVERHVARKHAELVAMAAMPSDPQPAPAVNEGPGEPTETRPVEPVAPLPVSVYANGTSELHVQDEMRAIIAEIASISGRLSELQARLAEILRMKGVVMP